jgi:cytochrome c oxidase subunit 2
MLVVCATGLILTHAWLALILLRRSKSSHPSQAKVPLLVEYLWTLLPAIALIALALIGQQVWSTFRTGPTSPHLPILIIGQQYQWNFIYPGLDRTLGQYLRFPNPTDPTWPPTRTGTPRTFAGVPGPAFLPPDQAARAISDYIEQLNPLGQDPASPAAADDNTTPTPGRPLELPADTDIELLIGSKDVIHAVSIPAFRLKMDALPGHTTRLRFRTPPTSTAITFELMCMEFCGLGHSIMRADVILLPADQWHSKYSTAIPNALTMEAK